MAKPQFFFDTADIDYIKRVWERLAPTTDPTSIVGITTNPNALDKINCRTLEELEVVIYKLARFLTVTRREPDFPGEVHIQLPISTATINEHRAWAQYISELGDGKAQIFMKLPPFDHILSSVRGMTEHMDKTNGGDGVGINVTGIADATTAYRCLSHDQVKYASIIPGRMSEMGINSVAHLRALQQRAGRSVTGFHNPFRFNQFVIAGSMRTVAGLKEAIMAGTIPTIGQRVWDSMTDNDYVNFSSWWNLVGEEPDYIQDIPLTDDRNVALTASFFSQMDQLGEPMMHEFRNRK